MRQWGRVTQWSVHNGSSLLLLPTHPFSLLQYEVPPYKIQSFINSSCMGSPRAAASVRKPAPVWSPLHRLQLLPGVCSGVGSSQAAAAFSTSPPAAVWDSPWAAVQVSAPPWSSTATEESLRQCLEYLLPLLILSLWCLQDCFTHIFLTLHSHSCCAALFSIS